MIYLATDHRGFELKEKIKEWLTEWGLEFTDMGDKKPDEQDDYPDFVHPAAAAVAKDPTKNRAIILGATGQGEAMVANRYKGVRAAVYYGGSNQIIEMSREHNDANILSLGVMFIDENIARSVIHQWLNLGFSGEERHVRRIAKIDK